MTLFHRSALARLGAVALLAVGGLATVAAPASAADQATLDLVPLSSQLALGVKEAKAKPFKFSVQNVRGTVDAKDVKVTVETAGLKANKVGVLKPDGCAVSGTAFTCSLSDLGGTTDDIAAGTTEEFGIPLFGTDTRGKGGVLKVTVSGSNTTSDSVDHEIMVVKPGYDLTTWVQDVYADVVVDGDEAGESGLTGVKPGGTAPLDWALYNGGSRRATGIFYGIALPDGATFVDLPESCVMQDLGGVVAYCEDTGAVLRPGEFYTADVRVKVGAGVTEKVLTPGVLFAAGLTEAEGTPEEQPQVASKAQRKIFTETDDGDNTSLFDVFVDLTTGPSPSPSPSTSPTGQPSPSASASPTTGGGTGGGDGGLPVTGAQATLIGGIGAAVLLAGGALLMLARRRRLVLVTPGDEKPRS
ncbi:LPXTG cell wall anchor domain-containing protein [Micromonospora sp. RL09-050-HVF-A]|uniref:LPXTG cell wall anchor domain-containing protein n=1 Tax=Micromonospora sp. RL09-050-HVF-A TaxID=1703433 RepID=UPI001C5D14AB|nr:LPXTG cell wall anchor domain-containing protein [Micromonospora sp. RL09-050-HVF-A]MBW4704335.1 LPXTG cell wall anchor domain-containing protein [Micromonospora sp. RL09-050-HVF-A]